MSVKQASAPVSCVSMKKRLLGYFLDRYTKEKNFSVYMGHSDDAAVGCDLFISYFIWDAAQ